MPVLPDSVAERLIGEGAAVAEGQHLLGYWPASLADLLDRHLAESEDRSMRGWLARVQPRLVQTFELPNINRPEDLHKLEG
jgi:molybdopterin-guanine dinucleotide biosynthesis protein A